VAGLGRAPAGGGHARRGPPREQYASLREAADDWELPRSIRTALTTWRFEQAAGLLAQAGEVLEQRADITAAAAAAGLAPPDTLESVFESDRGFPAADAEARAELATIDAIVAAGDSEPVSPGPIERLGLIGSTPDVDLEAARAAFASGELATAVEHADAARAVWTSVGDVGGRRALSILGACLLAALAVALAVTGLRSRRRRRLEPRLAAGPQGVVESDAPGAGDGPAGVPPSPL
jgi:hypothetical protein